MPLNAVSEAVQAPAFIPCLSCNDEWLSDPAQLRRQISAFNDVQVLIPGCECDACVSLAAEQVDPAAPLTLDEQYDLMLAVRISRSIRYSTEIHTVAMCPSCTSDLHSQIAAQSSCNWCDHFEVSDLPLFGYDATAVSIGRRQSLLRADRGRSDYRYNFSSPLERLTDDRNILVCEDCLGSADSCDGCERQMQCDSGSYCDDCETNFCSQCWESGQHYDHGRRGYDSARHTFECRSTITSCLNSVGTPGQTILSTRALGIEVETARGRVAEVIAAERNSDVPVLAGVGTDGSVRGRNPVEFRLLPARGSAAEYAIASIGQWCTEAGYAPDTSAGVHMHVDCSGLAVCEVWAAYAALLIAEPLLFAHAAAGRITNSYCLPVPIRSSVIASALRNSADPHVGLYDNEPRFDPSYAGVAGRYHAVNGQSYSAHRTLEVRAFDSAHDDDARLRYTDIAAIITAIVDFSLTTEFTNFVADREDLATLVVAADLVAALAEHGHITRETLDRAQARLGVTAPVAA